MSKYAILHGNYNVYHADFDNYEEAKEYYDHQIEVEGYLNDLQLCKILETHEAPEPEYEPLTNGRHWNIDTSPPDDIAKNWKRAMKNIHSEWFNRGKY